jgi:hypothetical protein
VLFAGGAVATAQETGEPLAPAECTAEPLTYERLAGLIAVPVVDGAEPEAEASPVAVSLPEGEPADEATTAAVQETVQQVVACVNAGELDRVLGLYSDGLLATLFAGEEITEEDFADEFVDRATPAPGEETVLYSFSEVVITADGRAAVVAVGDDQSRPGAPSPTLFYLVEQDGRWLIDETVESPEPDV